MRVLIFALIITLFLISGCTNKNNKDRYRVIKTYYDNGNVEYEIQMLNDSIPHGQTVGYYPNGKLKLKKNYIKGIASGWRYDYFENGCLEDMIHFDNGFRNGNSFWFYSSGILKEESNWINDSLFGNAIYYFENGKIDTYSCNDYNGDCFYLIKFDTTGNKIREEGELLAQILVNGDYRNFPISRQMSLKIISASPPNYKVIVSIGLIKNGKMENTQYLKVQDNVSYFNYNFTTKGEYTFVTIVRLNDHDGVLG